MTVTKALSKLYLAVVGEETKKNSPTKIISDLADNWSGGGGGSGNERITLTNTLEMPFEGVSVSDLKNDLLAGDATVTVVADASALGAGDITFLVQASSVGQTALHANGGNIVSTGTNQWDIGAFVVTWNASGEVRDFDIAQNGTVSVLSAQAQYIPCETTILRHKMPSE